MNTLKESRKLTIANVRVLSRDISSFLNNLISRINPFIFLNGGKASMQKAAMFAL